jgi:SAM-dependent methyltransferase
MVPVIDGLTSVYSMGNAYSLLECTFCKTWFTSPSPTQEILSEHYSSIYAFRIHHLVKLEKIIRARKLIKTTKLLRKDFKVLELGVGAGELSKEMAKHVESVFGCDLDPLSVEKANLYKGIEVKCKDAIDYVLDFPKEYFDVAVFSHTLEHFLNPSHILEIVASRLKPGAKTLIVVPNRLASPKFFKRNWGYWQVPVHITHHSPESISNLCHSANLNVDNFYFRHSDFMALGSYILNFRTRVRAADVSKYLFLSPFITIFAVLHSLSYRLGRQDMIVIASKKTD